MPSAKFQGVYPRGQPLIKDRESQLLSRGCTCRSIPAPPGPPKINPGLIIVGEGVGHWLIVFK